MGNGVGRVGRDTQVSTVSRQRRNHRMLSRVDLDIRPGEAIEIWVNWGLDSGTEERGMGTEE